LCTQLEELNLSPALSLMDVEEVVLGSWYDLGQSNFPDIPEEKERPATTHLTSLSNAVAVFQLQQRIFSLVLKRGSPTPQPKLRHLDLHMMSTSVKELQVSLLLGPHSLPLAIIELPFDIIADLQDLERFCVKVGWNVKSFGRRVWIERKA